MKKNIYILLLLYSLFPHCMFSQSQAVINSEYSYRRYSINNGLPENICWNLFQDSDGFIWIATSAGLVRYDGYEFKSYIRNQSTTYVTRNQNGNITAFNRNRIHTIFPDDKVESSAFDKDNSFKMLVGKSLPEGYVIYENSTANKQSLFSIQDTAKTLIFDIDLTEYPDMIEGRVYWEKGKKQIYLFEKDKIHVLSENGDEKYSIESPTIYSIVPSGNNTWVIATDGIYKLSGRTLEIVYRENFVFDQNYGIDALSDNENNLIISAFSTVYRFDGSTLEIIFNNEVVSDILLDRENNLWIATLNGLYNCFKTQIKNHTLIKNPSDGDAISSSVIDEHGNIWFASTNGELMMMNDNGIKNISYPIIKNRSFFLGFPLSSKGNLYFPGGKDAYGVLRCYDGKCEWLDIPDKQQYAHVVQFVDGNIILAGFRFLYICNPSGTIIREYKDSELFQEITSVAADKQGRIYAGGLFGVTIIDEDSIKFLPSGEEDCRVLVDENQTVWVSVRNTLCYMENDSLIPGYTFQDQIRGFHFTKNGYIIVQTISGFYVSKRMGDAFFYYNNDNGFTGERFSRRSIIEDNKGNVWLIAAKVVVSFKPERLLQKQAAPLLHLMSVKTSDNNYSWQTTEKSSIKEFTHRENNIRFNYIGLCHSEIENVRYQYNLKGFQEQWSEPITNREVTFNNLNPGKYEFQIKAYTGTPDIASEMVSFSFIIKPAFWQTTLFWVVCAALLMLSGAGIMSYFQRKKSKKLIEHLETERQLNDLKISSIRLKAIPHFNANVMAAIEYYIMNKSKEEAMRILGVYSRFMFETLQDVDKASRSLSEELEYVKMYLELEKLRFIDKFDFEVCVDDNVDADSVLLPNMILHTWAENAVKHGLSSKPSGGKLQIKAVKSDNNICVSVEDNGVGREAAANNPRISSSKQGLSILSQQIAIYNRFNRFKILQKIEDLFADGHPSGTKFSLEVPSSFIYDF